MFKDMRKTALELLTRWGRWAEFGWYQLPDNPSLGCFGTGYDAWGTQTNQKYLAAMATLSALGPESQREHARQRALAALHYELATHVSEGTAKRTDGSLWGRNCFSALGIERMMHAWPYLEPHADDTLRATLRRVLLNEAQWVMDENTRHGMSGVFGGLWEGMNVPESNLWSGALLWRVTEMYPDYGRAEEFREKAHEFLINAVSVPKDADDKTPVAGKPVRARHVGANFFPSYALDHHGYLNVGYMVICASNAAMLHFDMKMLELSTPESLDHHQRDLWQVIRQMVFSNGRLARIGGDSRVPYTYCQEYLIPALLYAADHLDDSHAIGLLQQQLEMIRTEAQFNGDGSFYGKRLAHMAASKPFYYSRLETDRAVVLSMLATYLPVLKQENMKRSTEDCLNCKTWADRYEKTVSGSWIEPEHGAVMQRGPGRLASVAWRAYGWPQILCLPPDDGHLADWYSNLVGVVRCLGDDGVPPQGQIATRRLIRNTVRAFDGGFAASAEIAEGDQNYVPEGLTLRHQATSYVAACALPDDQTMVIFHRCVANQRVYTHEVKGLHLSIPNDLFNNFKRTLTSAAGEIELHSPAKATETVNLESRWACVDGRLGVIGIYGADSLCVHRVPHRRGGKHGGLYTEEICFPCLTELTSWDKGAAILDTAYVVLSCAGPEKTKTVAETIVADKTEPSGTFRAVFITGADGRRYRIEVNLAHKKNTTIDCITDNTVRL